LAAFGAWQGVPAEFAAAELLQLPNPEANALVLAYRQDLYDLVLAGKLSVSTMNLRLVALRSLAKTARILGLVPTGWAIEIAGETSEAYKDTAVHTAAMTKKMLKVVTGDDAKAKRDRAIIWLLGSLGLRRGELVGLSLEHVDLLHGKVVILGKGRLQRDALTLPRLAKGALAEWMEVRGDAPGPLFLHCDLHGALTAKGLDANGLYYIIRRYGRLAGLGDHVRPHLIRHGAVTEVWRRTGDIRTTQAFSRHKSLDILQVYIHNAEDAAGRAAELVADSLGDDA
jgi:integrase/recombinase XerC